MYVKEQIYYKINSLSVSLSLSLGDGLDGLMVFCSVGLGLEVHCK